MSSCPFLQSNNFQILILRYATKPNYYAPGHNAYPFVIYDKVANPISIFPYNSKIKAGNRRPHEKYISGVSPVRIFLDLLPVRIQ